MDLTGREKNPVTERLFLRSPDRESRHCVIVSSHSEVADDFRIIEGKTIGRACIVRSGCISHSSIGQHVTIEENVLIGRGVRMGVSSAKHLAQDQDIRIGRRSIIEVGAHIYPATSIGPETRIGRAAHIGVLLGKTSDVKRPPTILGYGCEIGDNVHIDAGVQLGRNVLIVERTIIPNIIGDNLKDSDNIEIDEKFIKRKLEPGSWDAYDKRIHNLRIRV